MTDEIIWKIEENNPLVIILFWRLARIIMLILGPLGVIAFWNLVVSERLIGFGVINDRSLRDVLAIIFISFIFIGISAIFFQRPFLFSGILLPATYTINHLGISIKSKNKIEFYDWNQIDGFETAAQETFRKQVASRAITTIIENRWGKFFNIYLKSNLPWKKVIRVLATNQNKNQIGEILQRYIYSV